MIYLHFYTECNKKKNQSYQVGKLSNKLRNRRSKLDLVTASEKLVITSNWLIFYREEDKLVWNYS